MSDSQELLSKRSRDFFVSTIAIPEQELETVAGLIEGMLENPSKWQTYIPQLSDWVRRYKEKR